jgi:two-component system KDP operon response regulator KdpE
MTNSILVIEDEANIRQMLSIALRAEGYDCLEAPTVAKGTGIFTKQAPDLVILDLGLPDGEGADVLSRIRQTSRVPVLVLSARDQEVDKVQLLSQGANDYVSKPFGIKELVVRVKVLLRDFNPVIAPASPQRVFGAVTLSVDERMLTVEGNNIALAPKEVQLLDELTKQPGEYISQQELIRRIWGHHHSEDSHYIRVLVRQLRKKLDDHGCSSSFIENMPKKGYRFSHS